MLRKEENSRKLVNVNIGGGGGGTWEEGRVRRKKKHTDGHTDHIMRLIGINVRTYTDVTRITQANRHTLTRTHTHTLGLLTYYSLVPFCTHLDIYESDGPLMYLNKKTCERVEQKLNAFPLIIHKHSRWMMLFTQKDRKWFCRYFKWAFWSSIHDDIWIH